MPREHGESGEYVETVTLADVLDTFDHVEGPVVLSADVADRLGCSRETARRKLEALHDRGDVRRRKVSRRVIYWEPEEEDRREPTDAARSDAVADATDGPADPPADAHGGHAAAEEDPLDAALADLRERMPGSGSNLDAREQAAREIFHYLKEHGKGQKSDFQDVVDAEAVGYGGATPFDSFWNNCMDSGALLAALPGVHSPGEGGHVYTYTADAEGS